VSKLNAAESVPFVGEALQQVRAAVGDSAAVLGFVGAPFTLATYIVEGGTSKDFQHIKKMAFTDPLTLHTLLDKLSDSVADYCRYQADNGAQVIQIFDSWASNLMPQDFDVFSAPYLKKIIDSFRLTHPHIPIILYIVDGIKRVGDKFAIQGNMDPGVLFGDRATIEARTVDVIKKARSLGVRHVMNLGHGVLPQTPEENVAAYFEAARGFTY
jgi:uroporphyrinogen decarboxylase